MAQAFKGSSAIEVVAFLARTTHTAHSQQEALDAVVRYVNQKKLKRKGKLTRTADQISKKLEVLERKFENDETLARIFYRARVHTSLPPSAVDSVDVHRIRDLCAQSRKLSSPLLMTSPRNSFATSRSSISSFGNLQPAPSVRSLQIIVRPPSTQTYRSVECPITSPEKSQRQFDPRVGEFEYLLPEVYVPRAKSPLRESMSSTRSSFYWDDDEGNDLPLQQQRRRANSLGSTTSTSPSSSASASLYSFDSCWDSAFHESSASLERWKYRNKSMFYFDASKVERYPSSVHIDDDVEEVDPEMFEVEEQPVKCAPQRDSLSSLSGPIEKFRSLVSQLPSLPSPSMSTSRRRASVPVAPLANRQGRYFDDGNFKEEDGPVINNSDRMYMPPPTKSVPPVPEPEEQGGLGLRPELKFLRQ